MRNKLHYLSPVKQTFAGFRYKQPDWAPLYPSTLCGILMEERRTFEQSDPWRFDHPQPRYTFAPCLYQTEPILREIAAKLPPFSEDYEVFFQAARGYDHFVFIATEKVAFRHDSFGICRKCYKARNTGARFRYPTKNFDFDFVSSELAVGV